MYIHTKGKIQLNNLIFNFSYIFPISRVRRGRDRVVVGFIITYAISAYHHGTNIVNSNTVQTRFTQYNIM